MGDRERTVDWYRRFAAEEARERSPLYESWALGVAEDGAVLDLLEPLPLPKRQPNLLFGASRLAGAPVGPYAEWREWVLAHAGAVTDAIATHWTQTNEVLRCAALLPALALVPGPIALLEVGASAGLCLFLDRYSYRWRAGAGVAALDSPDGPSSVLLEADVRGRIRIPERMPRIVWRAGIDRAPLDAGDDADARWLETLVWPEEEARRVRLRAALAAARREPVRVVAGDVPEGVAALAAEAPADATLVVLSSAASVYLAPDRRAAFLGEVTGLGARLLSLEGRGIVPAVERALDALRPRGEQAEFVLALDDEPLALVDPHGSAIDAEGIPWPK